MAELIEFSPELDSIKRNETHSGEPQVRGAPLFLVLLRSISLCIMAMGFYFWGCVLGLFGEDLLEAHNRVPAIATINALLAIMLPILSTGLWLGTSWSFILWFGLSTGLLFFHFYLKAVEFYVYISVSSLFFLLLLYGFAYYFYKIINIKRT